MTSAPTPAGGRHFSGNAVLAVVGMFSIIMGVIVVIFVQRDVTRAMDERSDEPVVFENIANKAPAATDAMAQPVGDDEPGWWLCALLIEGTDNPNPPRIQFYLWLPPGGDERGAYIRNGEEFTSVDHLVSSDSSSLTISFPYYDSVIQAEIKSDDKFMGNWIKQRSDGPVAMIIEGKRIPSYDAWTHRTQHERLGSLETAKTLFVSLAGPWRMEFAASGIAKGVFKLADPTRDSVNPVFPWSGTILTPTGDYRYLSGETTYRICPADYEWTGQLSVFDGAHAFLFLFDAISQDELNGHFYSGNTWQESFTATRLPPGEDFDLPDPFSQVGLKPGETKLHLPQLDDPKYAGKPVIVKVMGTWCPNCHDATRLLVEYYEKYHDEGLEILALAYEHTDDEARSLKQIARFKERLGATWDIIPAGVSDKKKTAATLPALTDIKSYPTTIFLNRDHTVEAIHSGFSGPATGDDYTKTRAEFERLIKKILDS